MDIPVKSAARPSKENFVYNDKQKNVWISPKKQEKIWRQHVTLVAKPGMLNRLLRLEQEGEHLHQIMNNLEKVGTQKHKK